MSAGMIRAAIVGASTLLGKDLAEELNLASAVQWDLILLDREDVAGQITAAADEPLVIQPVTADSFSNIDVAFFAGSPQTTLEFWRDAVKSGAAIVDLTGGLEGEKGVTVRSPLLLPHDKVARLDLSSEAVVSAHPAAIMLGVVLGKLQTRFSPFLASATVLEPASQQGSAGLDEMHAQTVNLLSFKPLPQETFDTQVAFNLSAELGNEAKVDLSTVTKTVRRHLAVIAGETAAKATAMQIVQAPVFSGYTASVFVTTASTSKASDVETALAGDMLVIPTGDDPSPSNQSAAQQGLIQIRVRTSEATLQEPNGFWLWMAADNLRLAARNAVACAAELLAVRPGKVTQ